MTQIAEMPYWSGSSITVWSRGYVDLYPIRRPWKGVAVLSLSSLLRLHIRRYRLSNEPQRAVPMSQAAEATTVSWTKS